MERGYRALKIDPFGAGHFELDHAETHALGLAGRGGARRHRAGGRDDARDARPLLARAPAIRLAEELEPFKPAWLEEPVPAGEPRRRWRRSPSKVDMPVATGERIHDRIEFRELFERQAVDIIQPDIGHIGGILETRKLAATAEAHYVLVAPHNVGGPVLTAANLHLGRLHAELQDPGALQRLRRRGDQEGAPGLPRGDRRLLRTSPTRPASASSWTSTRPPSSRSSRRDFDLWAEGWEQRKPKGAEVSTAVVVEAPGEHRMVAARAAAARARRGAGAGRTRPASAAATARCTRATGPRGTSATRSTPGHEWSGTRRGGRRRRDPRSSAARSSARAFATARSATACRHGRDDAVHGGVRGDRVHPAGRDGRPP